MRNRYRSLSLILLSLMMIPAHAQRDYNLIEQRNPWLTSDNAAALTTFEDSTISKADIFANYTSGGLRTISQGKQEWTIGADVRSYYHLSDKVVAYGNASYKNFTGTDMDGSMFFGGNSLYPFDILDDSLTNTGKKHYELFQVVGAIGWSAWKNLSVGAKADFSAGNYAKYKDLRHRNTMMNLNTNASILYNIKERAHIGLSFLYRRSTETMQYDIYGTTDHVYKSFIEYANGIGEVETYGGEGFTDGSQELPLFNEYCGFSIQGSTSVPSPSPEGSSENRSLSQWGALYGSFSYLHRNGYYGKESQYTASHEHHNGNIYDWSLRYTLPNSITGSSLQWLSLHINDEQLTAYRNNYREVKSTDNVTSYEYYTPTKMSDKIRRQGDISYNGYYIPALSSEHESTLTRGLRDIFLWHVKAGLSWIYSRQTAYLNLDSYSSEATVYIPHIIVTRNILFRNTRMLTTEAGLSYLCGKCDKATDLHLRMAYEIPLSAVPGLRPNIAISYDWQHYNTSLCSTQDSSRNRHHLQLSIGAIF